MPITMPNINTCISTDVVTQPSFMHFTFMLAPAQLGRVCRCLLFFVAASYFKYEIVIRLTLFGQKKQQFDLNVS